jgi:hypothetical protein
MKRDHLLSRLFIIERERIDEYIETIGYQLQIKSMSSNEMFGYCTHLQMTNI